LLEEFDPAAKEGMVRPFESFAPGLALRGLVGLEVRHRAVERPIELMSEREGIILVRLVRSVIVAHRDIAQDCAGVIALEAASKQTLRRCAGAVQALELDSEPFKPAPRLLHQAGQTLEFEPGITSWSSSPRAAFPAMIKMTIFSV
jgi:hypothetical protein